MHTGPVYAAGFGGGDDSGDSGSVSVGIPHGTSRTCGIVSGEDSSGEFRMTPVHSGIHNGDGHASSAKRTSRLVLSVCVGVMGVDVSQSVLIVEFAGALLVRQIRASGRAAVDGLGGNGRRNGSAGASAAPASSSAASGHKRDGAKQNRSRKRADGETDIGDGMGHWFSPLDFGRQRSPTAKSGVVYQSRD